MVEIRIQQSFFLPSLAPHRNEEEVDSAHFGLFYVLDLDYMADVSLRQPIEFLHLFNGVVVLICQKICTAKFVKVALRVKVCRTHAWMVSCGDGHMNGQL